VPTLLDKPEKEIELTLEMLVRAYDPCISCSTHAVKVHFV
jgi:coenzyme F420-reducing hydrogenase alpha subunit